jgi:hypothetical protein
MRILKYSVFGIVIYLFKQRVEMTVEEFNILSEVGKKELLIDAKKITEYEDDIAKHELFRIDNFFVEVSISVTHRFRKITNTYSL